MKQEILQIKAGLDYKLRYICIENISLVSFTYNPEVLLVAQTHLNCPPNVSEHNDLWYDIT